MDRVRRKIALSSLAALVVVGILGGLFFQTVAFQSTNVSGTSSTSKIPTAFKIEFFTNVAMTNRIRNGRAVEGSAVYVNLILVDAQGNPVRYRGSGLLEVTVSVSHGLLSATNVYISPGYSSTGKSFGPIQWVLPSSAGLRISINSSASFDGHLIFGKASLSTVA